MFRLIPALLFGVALFGAAAALRPAAAQEPPSTPPPDSVAVDLPADIVVDTTVIATVAGEGALVRRHSPRGALFRALAVPGWGQIYNRQFL